LRHQLTSKEKVFPESITTGRRKTDFRDWSAVLTHAGYDGPQPGACGLNVRCPVRALVRRTERRAGVASHVHGDDLAGGSGEGDR
jgi:hypothetical protein